MQVLRGRAFDSVDGTAGHDDAIVNQRFVAMHFGGEDPIGRRIKLTPDGAAPPGPRRPHGSRSSVIAPSSAPANRHGDDPDPVAYLPLRVAVTGV